MGESGTTKHKIEVTLDFLWAFVSLQRSFEINKPFVIHDKSFAAAK